MVELIVKLIGEFLDWLGSVLPVAHKECRGGWSGIHYTRHPTSSEKATTISRHRYKIRVWPRGRITGRVVDNIDGVPPYTCRVIGHVDERRMLLDVERTDQTGHQKIELYYSFNAHEMKGYMLGRNYRHEIFVTRIILLRDNPTLEQLNALKDDPDLTLTQFM